MLRTKPYSHLKQLMSSTEEAILHTKLYSHLKKRMCSTEEVNTTLAIEININDLEEIIDNYADRVLGNHMCIEISGRLSTVGDDELLESKQTLSEWTNDAYKIFINPVTETIKKRFKYQPDCSDLKLFLKHGKVAIDITGNKSGVPGYGRWQRGSFAAGSNDDVNKITIDVRKYLQSVCYSIRKGKNIICLYIAGDIIHMFKLLDENFESN